MDFLKSVDTWFLIVAVVLLGGFFLWATQYILSGIKDSIKSLSDSIEHYGDKMEKALQELFNHKNNHESRIVALETRCDMQHGEAFQPVRQSAGRRPYDPDTLP